MRASKPPDKEKKLIKMLFWCLAVPVMALMFFRLFFMLFHFVYGTMLVLVLGERVERSALIISVITALIFTIGAIRYAAGLLKTHILNE